MPHVGRHPIGERGGHRVDEVPRSPLIPADVEPAVVADHDVLGVLRIDPDGVLIDVPRRVVAARVVERRERLSAVERLRDRQTRDVNRLVGRRIHAQLAEVHRPRVAVAHGLPRAALVLRTEHAVALRIEHGRRRGCSGLLLAAAAGAKSSAGSAVVAPVEAAASTTTTAATTAASLSCRAWRRPARRNDGGRAGWRRFTFGRRRAAASSRRHRLPDLSRLDLRVDDIRIRPRDVERDAAVRTGRQPVAGQLRPRLARVAALPQRAARSAAVETAAAAAPLIARGIENVAVRRIEHDVGEPRVVVEELDLVPALAPVRRFVDAAIRVRAEQMAGHRDVHRLRTFRIDHDARDRLRLLQPDVRKRLSTVRRLINAVAKRRGLPIVGLAGADVDDVRVGRVDGDVADRRGAVMLEHRLEGGAVVLRLEHAADGITDINDVGIALRHGDVVDAAAHARGADGAEAEARQQRIGRHVDHLLPLTAAPLRRGNDRQDQDRERQTRQPAKRSVHSRHPLKNGWNGIR